MAEGQGGGGGGRVIDLSRIGEGWGRGQTLGNFLGGPFFRRVLLPALIAVVLIKVLGALCFTYVRPNEYGIKVVSIPITGARGVHKDVYPPGFHLVLRPFNIEQMYMFPRDVQVLDLTGTRSEAAQEATVTRPAHIQTSDGFFVDVDVSILYRIVDPYLVFTRLGPGQLYETNGIVPKAEPVLKQTLGELTTEEFYVSPKRHAKVELARDYLDKDLSSYGLKIDHVLVRYFHYTEEIQRNIEEKKLKDQLVFKNQAEGRAATEGALLKKMTQEGLATIQVKLQEGAAYQTTKNAERDLYVRRKRAEADLLVKLAEAKKTQLRNEALQAAGSDRMVGLKMAELFQGIEILVLPSDGPGGLNPLNLDQVLKLLEVRREGKKE
jgi:regulator of protease activity HflC (stomatin/prohibitin superfamily)